MIGHGNMEISRTINGEVIKLGNITEKIAGNK